MRRRGRSSKPEAPAPAAPALPGRGVHSPCRSDLCRRPQRHRGLLERPRRRLQRPFPRHRPLWRLVRAKHDGCRHSSAAQSRSAGGGGVAGGESPSAWAFGFLVNRLRKPSARRQRGPTKAAGNAERTLVVLFCKATAAAAAAAAAELFPYKESYFDASGFRYQHEECRADAPLSTAKQRCLLCMASVQIAQGAPHVNKRSFEIPMGFGSAIPINEGHQCCDHHSSYRKTVVYTHPSIMDDRTQHFRSSTFP